MEVERGQRPYDAMLEQYNLDMSLRQQIDLLVDSGRLAPNDVDHDLLTAFTECTPQEGSPSPLH